jgi:N-acetylmuramoyl-L-alanine amidase
MTTFYFHTQPQKRLTQFLGGSLFLSLLCLSLAQSNTAFAQSTTKVVTLNPGHGYYQHSVTGEWRLQRGITNGIQEDFINSELTFQVNSKLQNTDLTVYSTRELSKSAGNHPSGYPMWQMGAREYTKSIGEDTSIWNGNVSMDNRDKNYARDTFARPFYANSVSKNIAKKAMISIHNNAGGGCGTETWYSTGNGFDSQSARLAQIVHQKLIQNLKSQWSPSWCDRKVKANSPGYIENNAFNGPAILIELAFMDNTSDSAALKNSQFQDIATTAIADGIKEYMNASNQQPDPEPPTPVNQCLEIIENKTIASGTTFDCQQENSILTRNFTVQPGAAADLRADEIILEPTTLFDTASTATLQINP